MTTEAIKTVGRANPRETSTLVILFISITFILPFIMAIPVIIT